MLRHILLAVLLLVAGPLPSLAQERFVLVVDGSSSMWGQVGGVTKIEILRSSLAEVLGQLDTDADVGVVAFGHREKGNCADIEELVAPRPFDPELIQAAIDGIVPKGKTPLSDAVQFAAEGMRFTEERATVVILGDGGENCGRDPCAVAEDLEQTGVDLTVHAIAFDIADAEGSAQLQCFATATGGMFLPVADAPELVAALEIVQQEVERQREATIEVVAVDQTTGAPLEMPVVWSITRRGSSEPRQVPGSAAQAELSLMPGEYDLRATAGTVTAEAQFTVGPESPGIVRLALPQPVAVRLDPVETGSGRSLDKVLDWRVSDGDSGQVQFTARQVGPLDLRLMPGDYIARISHDDLAEETEFTVGEGFPVDIAVSLAGSAQPQVRLFVLDAATGAEIGETAVTWTFINVANDEIVSFEAVPNGWVSEALSPGTYDVIVEAGGGFGEGRVVVTSASTEDVVISVAMPGEPLSIASPVAAAGSAVDVHWRFEGRASDLVFILPATERDNTYPIDDWRRHVVAETQSATLTAPVVPGDYEVRYFSVEAGGLAHRVALRVTPAEGGLRGPTSAIAGETVDVEWTAPGLAGDFLFVAPLDWDTASYPIDDDLRVPVTAGNPARLAVPEREGRYEFRYFSAGGGGALFSAPLEVVLPGARIDTPGSVAAGSAFPVEFEGPRGAEDRIFIAPSGGEPERYPLDREAIQHVQSGSPATLVAPAEPGDYEVRYFSLDKGGVLATGALKVTEADVEIEAPRLVQRASDLPIRVRGPRAPGDLVFIAPSDWADNTYPLGRENQMAVGPQSGGTGVEDGFDVLNAVSPAQPGTYEIRYFSWRNGTVLERRALIVR